MITIRLTLCRYNPASYDGQLEAKAQLVRDAFPEAAAVEVLGSPRDRHRMRAKVGIAGSESPETVRYVGLESGDVDVLHIAAAGIQRAMRTLLEALAAEPCLRASVTMVSFLGTREGDEVIASLVYSAPIDHDPWVAAAGRARRHAAEEVNLTLIGQAKGQRIVTGPDFVTETYVLKDGRHLRYKHILGHFSNPNAYACQHTLNWLCDVVKTLMPHASRSFDLLELYCGNGNHTVISV